MLVYIYVWIHYSVRCVYSAFSIRFSITCLSLCSLPRNHDKAIVCKEEHAWGQHRFQARASSKSRSHRCPFDNSKRTPPTWGAPYRNREHKPLSCFTPARRFLCTYKYFPDQILHRSTRRLVAAWRLHPHNAPRDTYMPIMPRGTSSWSADLTSFVSGFGIQIGRFRCSGRPDR